MNHGGVCRAAPGFAGSASECTRTDTVFLPLIPFQRGGGFTFVMQQFSCNLNLVLKILGLSGAPVLSQVFRILWFFFTLVTSNRPRLLVIQA